jgi:glycerol-3-phosphate dehydrogenase (NAD(P)+)
MTIKPSTIALLGAGSWGTAVAIHLAQANHRVFLWGRDQQQIHTMQQEGMNQRYLPGIAFPPTLVPTASLEECEQASQCILAVPSHGFKSLLQQIKKPNQGLSWLTKGVDPQSHALLSQCVAQCWGNDYPVAMISGPSFAAEVARHLPTALILAGNTSDYLHRIHALFHHNNVRVYLSDDIIGVQCCGAVKNILAIACGISDGLQYGANAKAALITRGLAEMHRLGKSLGARQETFMGLAGLGDLVLTCTDNQSRNRRFGIQLGQGLSPTAAEQQIGQVVEGKHNAAQICTIADQRQVEMPICQTVNALLSAKIDAKEAVHSLMSRPPREEY